MGQIEVLECLRKNARPMSAFEIADELGESLPKIHILLSRLIRRNDIYFIEIDRYTARKMYINRKIKRRMRLYLALY